MLFLLPLSAVFLISLRALHGLFKADDTEQRIITAHASANARIVDSFLVVLDAVVQLIKNNRRPRQRERIVAAIVVMAACVVAPGAWVFEASQNDLDLDGLAAGLGALSWACLLEITGSRLRLDKAVGRPVINIPVWAIALLFVIFDFILLVYTVPIVTTDAKISFGSSVIVGAAFVGLADIVSFACGVFLASMLVHPFDDS